GLTSANTPADRGTGARQEEPMTAEPSTRMELLRRTPRLVDEVVNRLRECIVDGTLPAGTPLPQVALAAQLGVSRTPLREALRVLDSEGLVHS
ncbi:MAG TPA: GntR family transcriptional regulator, partial [Microthrixaceae bacterium]|nr:GntR family transcriptional regulator [Microthrixaceae bacterium]